MKDHVPSPALFHVDNNGLQWRNAQLCKIPPQYVDTLRNLMQKKLTKLGQHYYQMFIMPEVNLQPTVVSTSLINTTHALVTPTTIATESVQDIEKSSSSSS